MKDRKFYKMKEEIYNKIISVAYGDAGIIDKIKINLLAKKDPLVKSLLDEYRSTSNAVHSINKEYIPAELLDKVKSKIGMTEKQNSSFFFDLYSFIFSRPIVSAASAIILIAVIVTSTFMKGPDLSNAYSAEEIALANRQAKQALAIVGKIFNQTENSIKNDILAKTVGRPINQGLNIVNDLFKEENKNEKLN